MKIVKHYFSSSKRRYDIPWVAVVDKAPPCRTATPGSAATPGIGASSGTSMSAIPRMAPSTCTARWTTATARRSRAMAVFRRRLHRRPQQPAAHRPGRKAPDHLHRHPHRGRR